MNDDRKPITETRQYAAALREAKGFGRVALRTAPTGKRAGKDRRTALTATNTKAAK